MAFRRAQDRSTARDVSPARTPGTILLVEDEPAIRSLIASALETAGYRVHQARNGQEALQLFDEIGPDIDLLLTDLRMPYVDGNQLVTVLRARRRQLKVLCISAFPVSPDMPYDFLAKPFSRVDLLGRVRTLLPSAGE